MFWNIQVEIISMEGRAIGSLKEIGQELGGLTVGGMSQIRKKLKEKLQKDNALRVKHYQCNETLNNE